MMEETGHSSLYQWQGEVLLVATLLFYSGTNYTLIIIVNELDGLFMFIDMVLVMAMPI